MTACPSFPMDSILEQDGRNFLEAGSKGSLQEVDALEGGSKCSPAGKVFSYIQGTEQLNKHTENNGSRFLSEGKEGTNTEMRKIEINPVVIDSD